MNKKTSKAKSVSADIEVRVKSASGTTYRALVEKRNKKVTYLCQHMRGAFTKDRKIAKPLTELVISGEYTLPHAKHREMVEKLFKVTLSAPERKPRRRSTNDAIQRVEVIPPWLMDDEETQPQAETPSDAEIEAALWQEVEEAREAERAGELNEPVTDVEPTAEAPAQESGVEPTKPEAAEVVEIKLTTYNLKKAGQAPVSITPESKDLKLEPGDQLIRIYKGTLIEVDILDSGYKWNGEVYPTLTHISWKATGYQIGGNNFFGLPTKRRGE